MTAGNAPGLNDGASALVVTSLAFAKAHGLTPLARVTGYATGGGEPREIFFAPVLAVRSLMEKAGTTIGDYDLIEANEAFAVQALADGRELGWDWDRVNVHGGAVALGHPIGASGARVLTTLLYALRDRGGRTGLATLCLGGGNAVALSVERCDESRVTGLAAPAPAQPATRPAPRDRHRRSARCVVALAAQVAVPVPFSPVPMTLQPLAVLVGRWTARRGRRAPRRWCSTWRSVCSDCRSSPAGGSGVGAPARAHRRLPARVSGCGGVIGGLRPAGRVARRRPALRVLLACALGMVVIHAGGVAQLGAPRR